MTDKRGIEYGVELKIPADKRGIEFGIEFTSQPPDIRGLEYGIELKMPADNNRPTFWKDGGVLHGAEVYIKRGGVGGTLTKIT